MLYLRLNVSLFTNYLVGSETLINLSFFDIQSTDKFTLKFSG